MFKKLIDKFKKKEMLPLKDLSAEDYDLFTELSNNLLDEYRRKDTNQFYYYNVKLSETLNYQKIKALKPEQKRAYVFWALCEIVSISKTINKYNGKSYNKYNDSLYMLLKGNVIQSLFRGNLGFNESEFCYLLDFFNSNRMKDYGVFSGWPMSYLIIQIEKYAKKKGLSNEFKGYLNNFLQIKEFVSSKQYFRDDIRKIEARLEKILRENDSDKDINFVFDKSDRLADFGNNLLNEQDEKSRIILSKILEKLSKVSSSKPSNKFLKDTNLLVDELGPDAYKNFLKKIFLFVLNLELIEKEFTYEGETFISEIKLLEKENTKTIKGLIWSAIRFHEKEMFSIIADLSLKFYKKIPGIGAVSVLLGNACLFYFGNIKGKNGVAHLSFLKTKVKQASIKKSIEKYIEAIAEKTGLSQEDIEESIVPDIGLVLGSKSYSFEEYTLKIKIERIGKVASQWIKPDGKIQKTAPAFIKTKKVLSTKLLKAKADIKDIKKYVTAQRNRIDSLFIVEKQISKENFHKYYLHHGLVSFIAQKLIWILKDGNKKTNAFFENNKWVDVSGKEIKNIKDTCIFQLWHPIYSSTNEIIEWRNFLQERQIVQPLKQAFREIYILTDAEIKTKSYSNRMASHIIKQHQFNSLASIRNWRYQLVGAWDHCSDCIARKNIKALGIEVQYWLNEIIEQQNDMGILSYMSTDQVRFSKENESIDLIDVPAIVFSESMRDVDLFVGVCSVGNDPEWADNDGNAQFRNYWTNYSFGDLSELAKTRKNILKNLLPRLKISSVASIEGNFLKVKGKIRNYKIHIGSSNILMEPNDQYLCIVASRKKDVSNNIFLPFEGDNGLSLVLSKAIMLAEDNKIKDKTITSQINHN